MSIIQTVKGWFGIGSSAQVKGGYDAARSDRKLANYYADATAKSAMAETVPGVRKILRNRARYELRNNSFARGMVETKAADVVGSGPKIQIQTENNDLNRITESSFAAWAEEIQLGAKLRRAKQQQYGEAGEAFLVFVTNERLRHPVKLDLIEVEADRVTSPMEKELAYSTDGSYVDGIRYDSLGYPVSYDIMETHPGDLFVNMEYDEKDADKVLHLFRPTRPGQGRGVPEISPALPLFALLRRYTLATVVAAETAANIAAYIYSDNIRDGNDPVDIDPFEDVDIEYGQSVTMPRGWKMGQLKAEHPTATHAEFKKLLINEVARCLNMPLNIAMMNSEGYNYASGRLDHQTYFKNVRIEQADLTTQIINPILSAWFKMARLAVPAIKQFGKMRTMYGETILPADLPAHTVMFDGSEHVDPLKEANAQKVRLKNNTTSLSSEYARQGKDWETELEQIAREKETMERLGLTTGDLTKAEEDDAEDDEPAKKKESENAKSKKQDAA